MRKLLQSLSKSKASKAQIVATLGPKSSDVDIIEHLARAGADVFRLNFSWGSLDEHSIYIEKVHKARSTTGKSLPIIQDLPGPRIQDVNGHHFKAGDVITEHDQELIKFGAEYKIEYTAVSFVQSADDIRKAKSLIKKAGGEQKVIAKIERPEAVDDFDEIIKQADAVMIARGDLGDNVPFEQLPFIERELLAKAKRVRKPAIVATEMMLSMTKRARPSRAEVTDVAYAITHGADGVMLSEETATGDHPVETVTAMERIVREAESRLEHELYVL
jgi:pyruvate kinase